MNPEQPSQTISDKTSWFLGGQYQKALAWAGRGKEQVSRFWKNIHRKRPRTHLHDILGQDQFVARPAKRARTDIAVHAAARSPNVQQMSCPNHDAVHGASNAPAAQAVSLTGWKSPFANQLRQPLPSSIFKFQPILMSQPRKRLTVRRHMAPVPPAEALHSKAASYAHLPSSLRLGDSALPPWQAQAASHSSTLGPISRHLHAAAAAVPTCLPQEPQHAQRVSQSRVTLAPTRASSKLAAGAAVCPGQHALSRTMLRPGRGSSAFPHQLAASSRTILTPSRDPTGLAAAAISAVSAQPAQHAHGSGSILAPNPEVYGFAATPAVRGISAQQSQHAQHGRTPVAPSTGRLPFAAAAAVSGSIIPPSTSITNDDVQAAGLGSAASRVLDNAVMSAEVTAATALQGSVVFADTAHGHSAATAVPSGVTAAAADTTPEPWSTAALDTAAVLPAAPEASLPSQAAAQNLLDHQTPEQPQTAAPSPPPPSAATPAVLVAASPQLPAQLDQVMPLPPHVDPLAFGGPATVSAEARAQADILLHAALQKQMMQQEVAKKRAAKKAAKRAAKKDAIEPQRQPWRQLAKQKSRKQQRGQLVWSVSKELTQQLMDGAGWIGRVSPDDALMADAPMADADMEEEEEEQHHLFPLPDKLPDADMHDEYEQPMETSPPLHGEENSMQLQTSQQPLASQAGHASRAGHFSQAGHFSRLQQLAPGLDVIPSAAPGHQRQKKRRRPDDFEDKSGKPKTRKPEGKRRTQWFASATKIAELAQSVNAAAQEPSMLHNNADLSALGGPSAGATASMMADSSVLGSATAAAVATGGAVNVAAAAQTAASSSRMQAVPSSVATMASPLGSASGMGPSVGAVPGHSLATPPQSSSMGTSLSQGPFTDAQSPAMAAALPQGPSPGTRATSMGAATSQSPQQGLCRMATSSAGVCRPAS